MNQFSIAVKKPADCSESELQDFAAYVRASGEVDPINLDGRIEAAAALCILRHTGCLGGVAAVKRPSAPYKEKVFKSSVATLDPKKFQYELGWIFILPSMGGMKLSFRLVEAGLEAAGGASMFATSRRENTAMHRPLIASGFRQDGVPYRSDRGEYELVLFVRE